MNRKVQPELLDDLPPHDPDAIHSRRDLRRLNWLMRHVDIVCAAAAKLPDPPKRIAEIGAGDGSLLLNIAKKMHRRWPDVAVTLIDRQKTVPRETLDGFAELGWQTNVVTADVFHWLDQTERHDIILANLFLHHFEAARLAQMLAKIAVRTDLIIACETRRTLPNFVVGNLLWLIGCNAVTCHDAILSMHAGFRGDEISALWPHDRDWQLRERAAIVFTHLFVAQKVIKPSQ